MATFPGLPLPDFPGFDITAITVTAEVVGLALRSTANLAHCPVCGQPTTQIRSRYVRTLADCSVHQHRLLLRVTARKFVCETAGCPRRIFCERLSLAKPHARTTLVLTELHRTLGLALGGQAGARLAHTLAIPTSGDTLIRRVLAAANAPEPVYRYVGVDDFALRRGQVYGTILVDLERGHVIDLFNGRDGAAFQAWLATHPGVEVITRDRWSAYAEAARVGAPDATQVADRFHLVKNVRELVERLLDAHSTALDAAFAEGSPSPTDVEMLENAGEIPALPPAIPSEPTTPAPTVASPREAIQVAKRTRRQARFEEVRRRRAEGQSLRVIARAMRMSPRTVLKYLRQERCPDWHPGQRRPTRLDRYRGIVDDFIAAGGRQGTDLWARLREAGCRSSYAAVQRYLVRRLAAAGVVRTRANSRAPPGPKRPTARQLSFAYVRRVENRTEEQRQQVAKLMGIVGLADAWQGVDSFLALVRGTATSTLADGLSQAEQSSLGFIRSFAESIRSDEAAVAAAVTTAWNNGAVEGHVNRLKAIKRSMFGRAKLPLLRARVCGR